MGGSRVNSRMRLSVFSFDEKQDWIEKISITFTGAEVWLSDYQEGGNGNCCFCCQLAKRHSWEGRNDNNRHNLNARSIW